MIFNIPNSISFLRLVLIPFAIYTTLHNQLVLTCVLIFLASFTDWLDGFAARRLNQFSRLGQLLDPISDRLYIVTLLYIIYYLQLANSYILLYIIGREVLLSFVLLYLKTKRITGLPVHYLGKMGAFCLMIGLPGLIFAAAFPSQDFVWLSVGWSFLVWGLFLYFFSSIKYIQHAKIVVSKYV
jgi:cardiolipin synthase